MTIQEENGGLKFDYKRIVTATLNRTPSNCACIKKFDF